MTIFLNRPHEPEERQYAYKILKQSKKEAYFLHLTRKGKVKILQLLTLR